VSVSAHNHAALVPQTDAASKVSLAGPRVVLVSPARAQLVQLLVVDKVRGLRHQPLHALSVRRRGQTAVILKDLHVDVDRLALRILDELVGARLEQVVERNGLAQRDVLGGLLVGQLAPELGQKVVVQFQVDLLVVAVALKLVVSLLVVALLKIPKNFRIQPATLRFKISTAKKIY